jgi:hypothetical protein
MTANDCAIGLDYDGLRIAVHSLPGQHLRWLEEFLTPAFAVGPLDQSDWRVTVAEDEARYAAIVRSGPQPGAAPVACFALDKDWICLPRWRSAEGLRSVVDEPACVAYEVDASGRCVTLVTSPGKVGVRPALMRVVRELAMYHARKRGGLLLHAAALAVGHHGLILAGEKNAGKTTLLVNLLRHGAARYVSNDRVLVSLAVSPPSVHGMPTIVSVRPGTLAFFPHLGAQLPDSGFHYRLTMQEVAAGRAAHRWSDGRFGLSPAQFCALLGVEQLGTCQAAAVVFPRIAEDERTIGLRQLSETEAVERLAQAVFGPPATLEMEWLLGAAGESMGAYTAATGSSDQLAVAVPCFECRLGRRAYESADAAAAITERLVA